MTEIEIIQQLSLGIVSSAGYDFLKKILQPLFQTKPNQSPDLLVKEIQRHLKINDANIAAKYMNFLAEQGDITIEGTKIFANDSLFYGSSENTKFEIKDGSSSRTDQTFIGVGEGDNKIEGSGGASIEQTKDGINFKV